MGIMTNTEYSIRKDLIPLMENKDAVVKYILKNFISKQEIKHMIEQSDSQMEILMHITHELKDYEPNE